MNYSLPNSAPRVMLRVTWWDDCDYYYRYQQLANDLTAWTTAQERLAQPERGLVVDDDDDDDEGWKKHLVGSTGNIQCFEPRHTRTHSTLTNVSTT